MAAPSAVTAESLITLKINHDGANKRFKLPLRDLGAATLETKLRAILNIAPATAIRFERYSDSAGSYVTLNSSDISVYKQLYRAAKAKQKLKFRVTSHEVAPQEVKGPKPASVEDVAEAEAEAKSLEPIAKNEAPLISLWSPADVQQQSTATQSAVPRELPSQLLAQVGQRLRRAEVDRGHNMMEHKLSQIEASVAVDQRRNMIEDQLSQIEASVSALNLAGLNMNELTQAVSRAVVPPPPAAERGRQYHAFSVYCNSCDQTIPGAHFHCSTCDDGDFDLCQTCVDKNVTCYGEDHWLIKRTMKNNVIINSFTERLAPRPKATPEVPPVACPAPIEETSASKSRSVSLDDHYSVPSEVVEVEHRTCNSCVQDYPDRVFVHCACCEDFDLCKTCFLRNEHGHDPKHGFVPAKEPNQLEPSVLRLLAPGRAQLHNAICDQCDVAITGIRHKCLDCPDFDYCSRCMQQSKVSHPGHRFVPLYEPTETSADLTTRHTGRPVHHGICCDGPLCKDKAEGVYIKGIRYKCAVCHDTDFCANCEATPVNGHNRTHPLIKFKTPVRFVSVSTSGECHGKTLAVAGDRPLPRSYRSRHTSSRSTETACSASVATNVQTIVNVQPSPSIKRDDAEKPTLEQMVEKPSAVRTANEPEELVAVYKSDTIVDGTTYPPNHVFEQTWVLKNEGTTAWPAGCSVKFVGGDYMGHMDPSHPAATSDLESTSESTVCYAALAPGQEFPFTVLLRTPSRAGRVVSNWRLTTKDGQRFGHRLWCDVVVAQAKDEPAAELLVRKPQEMATTGNKSVSEMIFPKLEKESPLASMLEAANSYVAAASTLAEEEYEDCDEDEEWADDDDEECFLTDEEYDVLDASDEEYLEEQQVQAHRI